MSSAVDSGGEGSATDGASSTRLLTNFGETPGLLGVRSKGFERPSSAYHSTHGKQKSTRPASAVHFQAQTTVPTYSDLNLSLGRNRTFDNNGTSLSSKSTPHQPGRPTTPGQFQTPQSRSTHSQRKGRTWTTARLLPSRDLLKIPLVKRGDAGKDVDSKTLGSVSGSKREEGDRKDGQIQQFHNQSSAHFALAGFFDASDTSVSRPTTARTSQRGSTFILRFNDLENASANRSEILGRSNSAMSGGQLRAQSAPPNRMPEKLRSSERVTLMHRPSTAASHSTKAPKNRTEQIDENVGSSTISYEESQYPGKSSLAELSHIRSSATPIRPASAYPGSISIKTHNVRENLDRFRLEQVALRRLRYVIENGEADKDHVEILAVLDNSELPTEIFQKFFGSKATNIKETRQLLMRAIERNERRNAKIAGESRTNSPLPHPSLDVSRAVETRIPQHSNAFLEPDARSLPLRPKTAPSFSGRSDVYARAAEISVPVHPSQHGSSVPPHFLEPSAYHHYITECVNIDQSPEVSATKGFVPIRPGSAKTYEPSRVSATTPADLLDLLRVSEEQSGCRKSVQIAAETARRIGVVVLPGTSYLPAKPKPTKKMRTWAKKRPTRNNPDSQETEES